MRVRLLAIVISIFSLPCAAFGQQAKLEGHVYRLLNGKKLPVSSIRVVAPGAQAQPTDAKGHFRLAFPTTTRPGQATRVDIDKEGWVIYEPILGKCVTQSITLNFEPFPVIIVPKRSLLALSPNRISQVIAQWTKERAKLSAQVEAQKDRSEVYAFLREYAEASGFSLEKFSKSADQWARIKKSDDKEMQALKEYWRKNYD